MSTEPPSLQKPKGRRLWLVALTFLVGVMATWVIWTFLDSLKTYLFTTGPTDLSTITAIFPIGAIIAFAFLVVFTIRYVLTQTKPGILRQLPPIRQILSYYVEIPVAWTLFLYTAPGLYAIYVDISTPCPPNFGAPTICYWSIQANEWVLMIHLGFIFGVVLLLDSVRFWLKDRRSRKP